MDKPLEARVAAELAETAAVEPSEMTAEQMQQVAGGQNGCGTGPPNP